MPESLHVVFGSGPVGRATAITLLGRGLAVRVVNRRGRAAFGRDADALREVEVVTGDAADTAFAVGAAQGAASVYQTLNPEYHRWAQDFPPLQRGVLAAAEAAGARFVNMDNVYSYGRPAGRALTEESPQQPHTRKGRVRLDMANDLWAAHHAGRVEVVSGRASDYYGPGAGASSPLGDRVLAQVVAGKAAALLGDPDLVHSYTYVPDIGEGLAVLGTADGVTGSAWHLPNDPEPRTSRAMVETMFELAGTPPRVTKLPTFALRAVGLFNPTVREVVEMAYEFEEPFVVDSSRIAALGVTATPIDEALEQTLAAYRAEHA